MSEKFECYFSLGRPAECSSKTVKLGVKEWKKLRHEERQNLVEEGFDGLWKNTYEPRVYQISIKIKADRQYDERTFREYHWKAGEKKKFFASFWAGGYGHGNSQMMDLVLDGATAIGVTSVGLLSLLTLY